MNVQGFAEVLGADFYAGVPDSQLRALCDYLMNTYGTDPAHHIIAANEGNCTALAAGYYLATGKVPVVYLQNSGQGNILNPVASLLNDHVYAIPVIFVIGWRGEPGIHDEPQHIYQGEVTLKLLEDMDIQSAVIDKETTHSQLCRTMETFRSQLQKGKSVAFVIRKGAFTYDAKVKYKNEYSLCREEVLAHILNVSGEDPIVSTTGKISRELFELREGRTEDHRRDFLTVGSMGHASSIALEIALQKPNTRVWCIDGDGAALMHMGAMAVIGSTTPKNFIHIVLNNCAHDTVGGMPTAAGSVDLPAIAKACGYSDAIRVNTLDELDIQLKRVTSIQGPSFVEVTCALGSRADLGRPTTTAQENKQAFMAHLEEL